MGKRMIDADRLIEILRARRQKLHEERATNIVENTCREYEDIYLIAIIDATAKEAEE